MSAKLYFRWGVVKSAKSLNLLATAHYYNNSHSSCFLIKHELEDRFGYKKIGSRAGIYSDADLIVKKLETIDLSVIPKNVKCVLVDEVQFFTKEQVESLRRITIDLDIPVIAYGLRTDYRTELFEGSKRMLELADSIEEVKNVCKFCNRKAIFNARIDPKTNKMDLSGGQIHISENLFVPTCSRCYYNMMSKVISSSVL